MIECDDFDLSNGFYLVFMHSLSIVAVPLNMLDWFIFRCHHNQSFPISVSRYHPRSSFLEDQQSRNIHVRSRLSLFLIFKFSSRISCDNLL
ncbi:hypothetical protein OSTOST_08259 [Ostertagia ostertagi]